MPAERYFSGLGPAQEKEDAVEGSSPLERGPRLSYLREVFLRLRLPDEGPYGEKRNWHELAEDVPSYDSLLQFTTNVRETVRGFVAGKMRGMKRAVPTLQGRDFSGDDIEWALVDNFFENVDDAVDGQRRKVLLAEAAHVVKRIEVATMKGLLEKASEEDLAKLGLEEASRDLLFDVLETAAKADPLFVRFLAYASHSKSGDPPTEATMTSLFVEGDTTPKTLATLFPKETGFITNHFDDILKRGGTWERLPGAEAFKVYIGTLAALYNAQDPEIAAVLQRRAESEYVDLVRSEFPIVVTTGAEGSVKEPYTDPELRVALRAGDPVTREEQTHFDRARDAMADAYGALGLERFGDRLRAEKAHILVTVGGFGVNLVFRSMAQEKPTVLFLNDQIDAYDAVYGEFMTDHVARSETLFPELKDDKKSSSKLERMSRTNSILHEYAHTAYGEDSAELKRLGAEPGRVINETGAETIYRALMPDMIANGGLERSGEEWAVSSLTSSLQMLRDQSDDDPYFKAQAYLLNRLFANRAIAVDHGKVSVVDFKAYWSTTKNAARDIISVYEDASMTPEKAEAWVRAHCTPSDAVKRFAKKLKGS